MLSNINIYIYILFIILFSFSSHAIAKEKWMSLNKSDPTPFLSKCYSEANNLVKDAEKKVKVIKNDKEFDVYITVCMADEGFFAL